jgi:hypothetical protein
MDEAAKEDAIYILERTMQNIINSLAECRRTAARDGEVISLSKELMVVVAARDRLKLDET